jgi:hypothetical protein
MEQTSSWEGNSHSASQVIRRLLWNPTVHYRVLEFYAEEFLAPLPTPKLEDYPLSAVRECLFNIFAVALHIWR